MIISVFVLERGSTFFRNAILLVTPIIECIQASRFSGSGKYSGWGFCEEPVSKNRAALKQPWQSLWTVLWELKLKPDILFRVWLREGTCTKKDLQPTIQDSRVEDEREKVLHCRLHILYRMIKEGQFRLKSPSHTAVVEIEDGTWITVPVTFR